jgi:hypothetical protein
MDWATVGVIAGLAALPVAALGVWATVRTIPPKRRLSVQMTATRLFSRDKASGAADRLTVTHTEFGDLTDPTVIRLEVRNTGRAAIASSMYDSSTPVRLHLGVKVLEVLEASNALKTQAGPPVAIEERTVLLGPGLIGQREWLVYELLADGDPHLSIEHSLIDVDVEHVDPTQERLRPAVGAALQMVAGIGGPASVAAAVLSSGMESRRRSGE